MGRAYNNGEVATTTAFLVSVSAGSEAAVRDQSTDSQYWEEQGLFDHPAS